MGINLKRSSARIIIGMGIPLICMIVGMGLIFYPFISEYFFKHRVQSEISTYQKASDNISTDAYGHIMEMAYLYNKNLQDSIVRLTDPFIKKEEKPDDMAYEEILSIDGSDIMAYMEIPAIEICLPIYHGTSAEVLEKGVGHLEGSSLPVGGENTHSVLTGHSGINKARLFTDLEKLSEGDLFFIDIVDERLAYEIYEIEVVWPSEIQTLGIRSGEDLVTLVTCTPYGINTHRLLVHGRRTEYREATFDEAFEDEGREADSQWLAAYKKALAAGVLLFLLIMGFSKIGEVTKQKRENN